LKGAFVPSLNSKWEIREIQTPKPSHNKVLIKINAGLIVELTSNDNT
jgi:D-arabinose 1-dehydrogenase-like Zn-dependent alcohol dehydrogenase